MNEFFKNDLTQFLALNNAGYYLLKRESAVQIFSLPKAAVLKVRKFFLSQA